MSEALGIAPLVGSQEAGLISAAPPTFPAEQPVGRSVIRFPEQLRIHRALDDLGLNSVVDEINEATRLINRPVPDPILITTNGTILAGMGGWRLAIVNGTHELNCIEYPLSEDESLQFILTYHQTKRGWNKFVRIRLALKLKGYLQARARDNMRAAGRHKGSANLPEAQHIDVRQEIASAASVCPRYVSYVGQLHQNSHPRIIGAARRDAVSQPGAPNLQIVEGSAIGAAYPLQRGPSNEPGDSPLHRSPQREKGQPRLSHSTRSLTAQRGSRTSIA